MSQKLFAFNFGQTLKSTRLEGAYDPKQEIWVGRNGPSALCIKTNNAPTVGDATVKEETTPPKNELAPPDSQPGVDPGEPDNNGPDEICC